MTQDLSEIPVEDLVVKKQETPIVNKIGSKEFCELLAKEFADAKMPWRTSKALAEKLNIDVVELDSYLRSPAAQTALQQTIVSRCSKEEGVFLYAFLKRVEEQPTKEPPKEVKDAQRPLVVESDKYALATIYNSFLLLEAALQKYALRIHECNSEAFTHLVDGKQKIEAGIALYATRIKADLSKMPKF